MVGAAGSNQTPKVRTTATALSYNASTGALTSASFVGPLTGNASTASSTPNPTFSNDAATKDNITTRTETGFYESSTGTLAGGWPTNSGNWHHLIAATHSNDANYYSLQLSSTFFDQQLYFRATNGSGTTAWNTLLHSGNYTSYVTSFATTDDTTTNASYYPVIATTAGGSTAKTSSTKLYFNPSTGTLNATTFNSLSDENQKTNITNIINPLSTIKQINGVEFDWLENGEHSAGVIAQKLEKILPFLVKTAENGEKSVNYSGLIAYLIESVKELSAEIEQLKANK